MKFSIGDRVTIKLPWHDRLMPDWKRKEYRVGLIGEIINIEPGGKVTVPQYDVRFTDGEERRYPEDYLKPTTR